MSNSSVIKIIMCQDGNTPRPVPNLILLFFGIYTKSDCSNRTYHKLYSSPISPRIVEGLWPSIRPDRESNTGRDRDRVE